MKLMKLEKITVDEMPVSCRECIFYISTFIDFCNDPHPFVDTCGVLNKGLDFPKNTICRDDDCPLEVTNA